MRPVDPVRLDLAGRQLIEASAGTGKTYTITGLYIRLLLERELSPERILVVTYTEAAAQELRDKIRARLAATEALFATGTSTDPFLVELRARYLAEGRDLGRLHGLVSLALINFDLAAVFTIHGFCLRVLQDSAFESGFPFEMEFVEDDHDLRQEVLDDAWRQGAPTWPAVLMADLCRQGISPDTLPERLTPLLRAVQTRGWSALRHGRSRSPLAIDPGLLPGLAATWRGERGEIAGLLRSSPVLSRAAEAFSPANLSRWFEALDAFFVDGVSLVPPLDAIEALSQQALITGTKPSMAGQTPSHPFFAQADELLSQLAEARCGLLLELVEQCGPRLAAKKARQAIFSFDDLLTGVRDGLREATHGPALATTVADRYPVALIDEFQDTDPLQYEIFTTIYPQGATLFMVGDPKQAIYGFRGADIFSYLLAVRGQEGRGHTLTANWRSEPELIRACNHLFSRHEAPFVLPEILFRQVASPGPRRRLVLADDSLAALTLVTFADEGRRDEAKSKVSAWLARGVQNLLAAAERGEAYFEESRDGAFTRGRALVAGDIAILVRNHKEGAMVKAALAEVGLAAVTSSRQSVFATEEARELAAILAAVAAPSDERQVRRALATRLLGRDAQALARLEEDAATWEATLEGFADSHRRWQERGVAAMLHHLWAREGVLPTLARQVGGERRLTNLRHLTELLQEASLDEALGPDALLRWFGERRRDERPGEASLLRLESDEQLLKIVTVHKSKGLQYPVVIAPFFWDSTFMGNKQPPVVECHDQDGGLLVDLGSEEFAGHRLRQQRERLAEELRLLYVAVTRAEHRCLLFWGRVRSGRRWATASSPLHYLLAKKASVELDLIHALEDRFAATAAEEFLAGLDAMGEESGGAITRVAAETLAESRVQPVASTWAISPARRFQRTLHPHLGLRSFSSLHLATSAVEEPDHDRGGAGPLLLPPATTGRDIFSFPRGAQAGSCLHAILERFDFQSRDQAATEALVVETLTLFGFERDWTPTICSLLQRLVATPLASDGGLRLAEIGVHQRLNELEFYYSLPPLPDRSLCALLAEGRGGRPAEGGRVGYMKGFIDLVFEWQERYYVVDYKSNYLGPTLADYGQERLAAAMRQEGYDLQYRIYTEALHRYLGSRLKDYDYDRHFGGVYYLFLRGLDPARGPEFGVFSARPERVA